MYLCSQTLWSSIWFICSSSYALRKHPPSPPLNNQALLNCCFWYNSSSWVWSSLWIGLLHHLETEELQHIQEKRVWTEQDLHPPLLSNLKNFARHKGFTQFPCYKKSIGQGSSPSSKQRPCKDFMMMLFSWLCCMLSWTPMPWSSKGIPYVHS